MEKVKYIEAQGSILIAHMDDGRRVMAYPATAGRWIASGSSGNPIDPDPTPGDWSNPLASLRCNQAYGVTAWSDYHSGIDLGAVNVGVPGDPVLSIYGGVVVKAGGHGEVLYANSGRGYIIDHGMIDGIRLYSYGGHMNSVDVSVGDVVTAGQVVGTMGGTGANHSNSDFAVHLHFVLMKDITVPSSGPVVAGPSDTIDPEAYLRSKGLLEGMGACPVN